jgi:hypothetical protein
MLCERKKRTPKTDFKVSAREFKNYFRLNDTDHMNIINHDVTGTAEGLYQSTSQ